LKIQAPEISPSPDRVLRLIDADADKNGESRSGFIALKAVRVGEFDAKQLSLCIAKNHSFRKRSTEHLSHFCHSSGISGKNVH
jgi:hypothetical protein